jgi:hypothetical protein
VRARDVAIDKLAVYMDSVPPIVHCLYIEIAI